MLYFKFFFYNIIAILPIQRQFGLIVHNLENKEKNKIKINHNFSIVKILNLFSPP